MGNGADDRQTEQAKAAAAKGHGYEGFPCQQCGNFTLMSHGDGFKCDTCGTDHDEHLSPLPVRPIEDPDGVPMHNDTGC